MGLPKSPRHANRKEATVHVDTPPGAVIKNKSYDIDVSQPLEVQNVSLFG